MPLPYTCRIFVCQHFETLSKITLFVFKPLTYDVRGSFFCLKKDRAHISEAVIIGGYLTCLILPLRLFHASRIIGNSQKKRHWHFLIPDLSWKMVLFQMYSIFFPLLLLPKLAFSVINKPPSIYRWIADSPYICKFFNLRPV